MKFLNHQITYGHKKVINQYPFLHIKLVHYWNELFKSFSYFFSDIVLIKNLRIFTQFEIQHDFQNKNKNRNKNKVIHHRL